MSAESAPPPPSTTPKPPNLPKKAEPTPTATNLRPYRPKTIQKKRIAVAPKRSCFSFCCCFVWFLILMFILAAAIAAAAGVFWLLYKPERPRFTIASLRLSNLNLTGNLDTDASGHLYSSGDLTISAKNPNTKIGTFYDAISMSTFSPRGVLIASSTFRSFFSVPGNSTVLRFVFRNDQILDLDAARGLRSDLGGRSLEMGATVVLETRMGLQIGKWRTRKIGIMVSCGGLRVKFPRKGGAKKPELAPSPAEAAAIPDDGSCKVNLSIKFWGFVF